jgi:hypothetical protein
LRETRYRTFSHGCCRYPKLEVDVLCLWGRVVPPDIRAEGLAEETIKEAWGAFRAVIKRKRQASHGRD